tara:strand:- start:900 stop:1493 length:594 start_codon:yes stop_codon:yes gene_type:complete
MLNKNSLLILKKSIFNQLKYLELKRKINKIKLLVLDVDGVLTDGKLYLDTQGSLMKSFDVKDGLGIKLLQEHNIKVVFFSGGAGGATEKRAETLKIDFYQVGIKNKFTALANLQKKLALKKEDTAYVGDDLNDIPVKKLVNIFFAPRDSSKYVLKACDVILKKNGGNGAIRELSERILNTKKSFSYIKKKGWLESNE